MTAPASLEGHLAELRQEIDAALERVLAADGAPSALAEPMRYSLLGAGKRLRPCLTLLVAETVSAHSTRAEDARALALPAACAVEMIHSYSLVHDDLPAMDNDALRRGRPTTHIVYGDGLAILAGDALLTQAFAVLSDANSPASRAGDPVVPLDRRLRAVSLLARAAGSAGMVGGQAIDLSQNADKSRIVDAPALEDMHLRKTGALIRAAAVMGAVVAGAAESAAQAVDTYARELGLAFQIVDDVLDVEGSGTVLGKTAGKDAAAGKTTFPALFGLSESKRLAAGCVERAKRALASAGLTGHLTELADWSLGRAR